jgi:CubicO group peptidase (beta-lactamase class C family)
MERAWALTHRCAGRRDLYKGICAPSLVRLVFLIKPQAYGHATLPTDTITTDTLFDLASTSKSTTAAAVALLVDDEKYPDVQWTTPVSKLLPDDFVLPDARLTEEVTIEDILSHRSGIACHDDSYLSVRAKNPDNAKSITRNLRNLEFPKPLRTSFIYSNIMFSVATHLVETVSGMAYVEFLKTKLWQPLDMTNTFHDISDIEANDAMNRKATGYHWNEDTKSYTPIPAFEQSEGQGAGCIFSSAGDYAKWIRALIEHSPPLSKDAHKDFIAPRSIYAFEEKYSIPFGSRPLYALGLVHESYRGRMVISHGGSVPGFKAEVAYMPEFDWGIVVFGNSDDANYACEILKWTLMDEVLCVPKEERMDWSAFYRGWYERDEEEDKEVNPEFEKPEDPEELGVPLEQLVGRYHDAGYKDLVLEMKDGKLVADCTDRCFPFMLTLDHLTANKFVLEKRWTWEGTTDKVRGEIRIESGKVTAVGVDLDEDVDGHIWFKRID